MANIGGQKFEARSTINQIESTRTVGITDVGRTRRGQQGMRIARRERGGYLTP